MITSEAICLGFLCAVGLLVVLAVYAALVVSGEADDFVFPDLDEEWQ